MLKNINQYFRLLLAAPLLLVLKPAQAQFAVVRDTDGFTNVRTTSSGGRQVSDTLPDGHIVYCFERDGNWINIDYRHGGIERNGFVYRDRLTMVDSFIPLPALRKKNAVVLSSDTISVIVTDRPFVAGTHQLGYDSAGMLTRIDRHHVWGADGGLPKREYASMVVRIGTRRVALPRGALAGLYEPNAANLSANYDTSRNTIYVHSANSDGAGGYLVIWSITDGVYKDRYVTHGF